MRLLHPLYQETKGAGNDFKRRFLNINALVNEISSPASNSK
jgi:hypothetical protein